MSLLISMFFMLRKASQIAKHLEPLKGGKIPIEIFVRGKDVEHNAKHFEKCLEVIKGAGVCYVTACERMITDFIIEESWHYYEGYIVRTICRRMEKVFRRDFQGCRGV